ncbi:hypothetical protein TNIN_466831 [Trichonephila inaurata madagascariensis]|uniref:Uncharacterized protein n=1 Tax=Trichonephila inaurata madagascariensis TaxID=2747483 RepID=A0A8X7BTX3_9ARAC|nr:hypothetical protein TNIN_466831 [Trichonephila inaurata madagascariensis]
MELWCPPRLFKFRLPEPGNRVGMRKNKTRVDRFGNHSLDVETMLDGNDWRTEKSKMIITGHSAVGLLERICYHCSPGSW